MRLEDCVLNFNVVVSAPLTRTEPEEEWVRAMESDAIPASLYDLYSRANFLSFGTAPSFLQDEDNLLFSYFSMLLRSLMEALVDADGQLRSFVGAQKLTYDAGKKIRREWWDPTADARARRHFRDLLIATQMSLDTFSDIVALFLTGHIPGLRLGRGQFERLEKWLGSPLSPSSPQSLHQLYEALGPLVQARGPETDWLPLMRLLRNKAAHLGQPMFRQVGLHDKTPKFYTFIPRQWPYIWERHIKNKQKAPADPDFLPRLFRDTLVHQDIVSYAPGLRAKVRNVIQAGVSVLSETYRLAENLAPNKAALSELQVNSEAYNF
jgi:hypothetical protein